MIKYFFRAFYILSVCSFIFLIVAKNTAINILIKIFLLPTALPYLIYINIFCIFNKSDKLIKSISDLDIIFVKLGQFLSMRPDLIGQEYATRLSSLQQNLPPISFKQVQKILNANLKNKINLTQNIFQNPISTASVAQVHKAILIDGTEVAIKVLKPKPKNIAKCDFLIIKLTLNIFFFIPFLKRIEAKKLIKEVQNQINNEFLLNFEASKIEEFKEKVIPKIKNTHAPDVIWQLTTQNILTTKWIEGQKICKKFASSLSKDEKHNLAAKITQSFLTQIYDIGIFHADPHLGNIIIDDKHDINLVDFGNVCHLNEEDKYYIAAIFYGFSQQKYDFIAQIHKDAGYISNQTQLQQLSLSCRIMGTKYLQSKKNDYKTSEIITEFMHAVKRLNIKPQPQLLAFQRTMATLEGVIFHIDKDFDILTFSKPWLKKWITKNITPEAILIKKTKKVFNNIAKYLLKNKI